MSTIGVEFGSTRIKSVLIDDECRTLASGAFSWENQFKDGFWTYSLEEVWGGLRRSLRDLGDDSKRQNGVGIGQASGLGVSGMMHGYLVFDADGNQLAPFRTWRNTTTGQAAGRLSELFGVSIPQRWSVAHLYQAILGGEPHVRRIAYITTLSGYVHWKLTGQKVLGIGDASGMFPVSNGDWDQQMVHKFVGLTGINWADIAPKVLSAGEPAGALLRPLDVINAGTPLCPPEGDAGTGMVATNSLEPATGNVSAGTSIFLMAVLDKPLTRPYQEIDMVATPTGRPVAMVHCNNGTSEIDAWVGLFGDVLTSVGVTVDKTSLYDAVYAAALNAEPDGGGLVSFNYAAGEHLTGFDEGRPLLVRLPDSHLTLGNFMRVQVFAALATLRFGIDILTEQEGVKLRRLLGHGGLFKSPGVGQTLMASAFGVPVSVMDSAGEGGAWGIAVLAAYSTQAAGETLEQYMDRLFAQSAGITVAPDAATAEGFEVYRRRYKDGLAIERAAVEHLATFGSIC